MSGPRLLIAHLFLPDTLEFQEWPEEYSLSHFRAPSQQYGDSTTEPLRREAPSSPSIENSDLQVDELDKRLSDASLSQKHAQDSDDDAISDSEGPRLESIDETGRTEQPSSSRRLEPRSTRGSFSEHTKRVNMTSLMNEAASGGVSSQGDSAGVAKPLLPHLQSTLHMPRPRRGSQDTSLIRPTSVTPGTDNGQLPVAPASDHGRSAAGGMSVLSRKGPSPGPQNAASVSRSRRGSMSEKISGGAALPSKLKAAPRETATIDSAGTRTPGAKAGGKAGTMTPLSIIGDLAAKQLALPPRQAPTAGDTDRHHPFGTGNVTPLREPLLRTPGGVRTPGPRPPISHSHSRAGASGLSLTKISDGTFERGKPSAAESSESRPRPTLQHSRATDTEVPSAMDNWFINEHGRGPDSLPPPHRLHRPTGLSRQASDFQAAKSGDDGRSPRHFPPQKSSKDTQNFTQGGPPAAPSSSFGRSVSKGKGPPRSGRRQSSLGSRSNRMSWVEDQHGVEGDATPAIPPFDFVPNTSSNGGLINAVKTLTGSRLRGGKKYIGTPGLSIDDWCGPAEKKLIAHHLKEERDCTPVWVDDFTFETAYTNFCKQVLWPTFHYTLPTGKGLEYEHEGFEAYHLLNKQFAKAIVAEYKEGDIIFVNDYHLLLVPAMVRERLPHAKICFFLHIAWPSSEIFRCLSARTHILRGMLGADLVGFQTANFARHFRQNVSRILQLEATPKGIQLDSNGGFTAVGTFPIGIDVAQLKQRRTDPEVSEWVARLRERYEGRKIVVGRDKLDSIKGVRQKLLAFEVALEEHKELVGKVVLLQVALATTEENEDVARATDVVARINNKFSSLTYQPVVFLHVHDMTFCQYLALLTVADAFLATSLREGMNLTSHEFVICQEANHKPLILSEFTGTYSSLRACIGVNPWNTKQVADAIHKAIVMDKHEAHERWKDLHRQVVTQDAQHWIESLLGRLERVHIDHQRRNNFFVPRLEIGQSEWRASKSRLLLLDLEGTLIAEDRDKNYEEDFEPPERIVRFLLELTNDAKNRVYILSGKGSRDLDKIVKKVPRLGLVAENGCAVMYAGSPVTNVEHQPQKAWTSLVAGTNMSWRGPVKEILTYFTERTPGSWLEDRGASIAWQFWRGNVDAHTRACQEFQWARRQAAEVQNLIYDSLGERFSLRIIPGATSFLIMPKNTSRASAVQHIVSLSSVGVQTLTASHTGSSNAPYQAIFQMDIGSEQRGTSNDSQEEIKKESDLHDEWTQANLVTQLGHSPHSNTSMFRQPSNSWSFLGNRQHSSSFGKQQAQDNVHMLHPYGLGSFDLVLCIGQDDNLFAYINSLDLPFAPITCTSGGTSNGQVGVGIGSEANYYVSGPDDVARSLHDILDYRGQDQVSNLNSFLQRAHHLACSDGAFPLWSTCKWNERAGPFSRIISDNTY